MFQLRHLGYTVSSLRALLHLADPEQRNAATVAFAGAIC